MIQPSMTVHLHWTRSPSRKSYPTALSPARPVVLKPVKGAFPVVDFETPGRLLHYISGPAIAVCPEWTLRAGLSLRVIDPLFMRAAYDSIRHDDRFGSMIPHEPEDVASNDRIRPNIVLLGEPTFQCSRLGALRVKNRNRGFARAFVVGTVERDSRDRITSKAVTSFLSQS